MLSQAKRHRDSWGARTGVGQVRQGRPVPRTAGRGPGGARGQPIRAPPKSRPARFGRLAAPGRPARRHAAAMPEFVRRRACPAGKPRGSSSLHGDAEVPPGSGCEARERVAGGRRMNIPDELLAAYVDGELQGAERARVEHAIAHDARVAQRVAHYRAMRARMRGYDSALHEPMPQRLLQVARSAARPASAQVIDLARVRAERKRRNERRRLLQPQRIAIAASLLGGLLVGALVERLASTPGVTEYRDGALLARGALADALSNQLADDSPPGGSFHVGMSFRAKSGDYCRTFSSTDSRSLAGLACHEQDHWQILTLADSPPRTAQRPDPRRVAWSLSPLVLQTVREHMSGEPLDAAAEARARGSDWR